MDPVISISETRWTEEWVTGRPVKRLHFAWCFWRDESKILLRIFLWADTPLKKHWISDQLHVTNPQLSSSPRTTTIKLTPCCRTSPGPPGCIWTLSCWRGSGWSPCPNCLESHWKKTVQSVWGNPHRSWCTSCSSFSNTATWWCTGGRLTTWAR